jgi:2',3'-cyclic-nucleotide 2'-phosphodiesterase
MPVMEEAGVTARAAPFTPGAGIAKHPPKSQGGTNLASGIRQFTLVVVKILFIGDVVGRPGRKAVEALVPKLRAQHDLNLVIANGENSAGGSGITVTTAMELYDAGVDIITTGDHLWDQKEVTSLLQNERRFVRPINYPPGTIGQGSTIFQAEGAPPIAVVNVQGRTFMPNLENPFSCMQAEVKRLRKVTPLIIVDIHAEATSEKIAMARYLDGQVSAVIGTHTHVQTADEQIFPGGTAFLCDAGFTGPHESVLGREIEPIIKRFTTNLPQRFGVASERILLQGALLHIHHHTGKAISIERVSVPFVAADKNDVLEVRPEAY